MSMLLRGCRASPRWADDFLSPVGRGCGGSVSDGIDRTMTIPHISVGACPVASQIAKYSTGYVAEAASTLFCKNKVLRF